LQILNAISKPIVLKFCYNTWIGPEQDNIDFQHDYIVVFFLIKKKEINRKDYKDFPLYSVLHLCHFNVKCTVMQQAARVAN